jgi:hypothetical protein
MNNNELSTARGKRIRNNLDTAPVTRHQSRTVFDRQVKIRFLLQSASYLGANLAQHELAARYLQD